MSIENDIFLKFSPDFDKLLDYGFIKKNNNYYFEQYFLNNSFKSAITISATGDISGTVYDIENDDEFLPLRVENQEGSFVGEVKNAYSDVLIDIRNKCFTKNYFISVQGNRITNLIYKKYKDRPLFLWDDTPSAGVFKNPQSLKWYGIIMYISRKKLGEYAEEMVEVMNLKLDKEEIPNLIKQPGFYPAYHMNKKYWITLTLDNTLNDNTIMHYVEESHKYTIKRRKK